MWNDIKQNRINNSIIAVTDLTGSNSRNGIASIVFCEIVGFWEKKKLKRDIYCSHLSKAQNWAVVVVQIQAWGELATVTHKYLPGSEWSCVMLYHKGGDIDLASAVE